MESNRQDALSDAIAEAQIDAYDDDEPVGLIACIGPPVCCKLDDIENMGDCPSCDRYEVQPDGTIILMEKVLYRS